MHAVKPCTLFSFGPVVRIIFHTCEIDAFFKAAAPRYPTGYATLALSRRGAALR